MKKVLTILAILVVLTSAVFADALGATAPSDSSSIIKIKSTVARKDPSFAIKTAMASDNVTGTETGDDAIYTAGDISQADITVTFGIYQTAAAKNRFGYSFTITADKFEQQVTSGTAYVVDKAVTVGTPSGWYVKDVDNGIGDVVAPAASGSSLTAKVTFTGKKEVAASETAKTTFDITWTADREAPAGDYIADVTMEIVVD